MNEVLSVWARDRGSASLVTNVFDITLHLMMIQDSRFKMMSQWDKQRTFENWCRDLNKLMGTLFKVLVLEEQIVDNSGGKYTLEKYRTE